MAAVAQNYTSNYTLFIKYNATEGYLEALERQKNDRPGKALNFIGTFQKKKKEEDSYAELSIEYQKTSFGDTDIPWKSVNSCLFNPVYLVNFFSGILSYCFGN